ncbi:MAG: hypothetical protein HUJ97_08505 [Bacteroidales bacterium]|nr:hypothetical protein [Bacteroidales bacterium]
MLKKKWNIFGAIFLFTLYFAYQVSITAFSHVHMVHGMMIIHSHPSKDLQHHNHTNEQIVSIALLSTIQTEEPEIASFELATPILLGTLSFCQNTFHVLTDHKHGISLRGPPSVL